MQQYLITGGFGCLLVTILYLLGLKQPCFCLQQVAPKEQLCTYGRSWAANSTATNSRSMLFPSLDPNKTCQWEERSGSAWPAKNELPTVSPTESESGGSVSPSGCKGSKSPKDQMAWKLLAQRTPYKLKQAKTLDHKTKRGRAGTSPKLG